MAEDPLIRKLPEYSKIVEKRAPGQNNKNSSGELPATIFNDTLKRPEALTIRRPSSIAHDLKEDMAGFGTADTIVDHFKEINEKNAADVIESYQKSFGNSLMHDIAREYEAGGLSLEARTACIKNLKNMLVNNIRKEGFDAPELFEDFDKELERQKNSFGRISTDKLDDLTNKMLDIISSNKEIKTKFPAEFQENRYKSIAERYQAGNEYGFCYKEKDGTRNINILNGYRESKQFTEGTSYSYSKQYSDDRKSVSTEYAYYKTGYSHVEKNLSSETKLGNFKYSSIEKNNHEKKVTETNINLTSPSGEKSQINLLEKVLNNERRETVRNGEKYTIYTVDDMLKVKKHNSNEEASFLVSEFLELFKPEDMSQVKSYINSLNGDVLFDVIAALHSKDPARCNWVKSLVANEGLEKPYNEKICTSNNKVWDIFSKEYKDYFRNTDKLNMKKDGNALYNACYSIIMTGKSKNEDLVYKHFPQSLIEMKNHLDKIHSYQLPYRVENNNSVY